MQSVQCAVQTYLVSPRYREILGDGEDFDNVTYIHRVRKKWNHSVFASNFVKC